MLTLVRLWAFIGALYYSVFACVSPVAAQTDTKALLATLESSDRYKRNMAAFELAKRKVISEELIEVLIDILSTAKDTQQRKVAAEHLGDIGVKAAKAVGPLEQAALAGVGRNDARFFTSNPTVDESEKTVWVDVQLASITALGKIKTSQAFTALTHITQAADSLSDRSVYSSKIQSVLAPALRSHGKKSISFLFHAYVMSQKNTVFQYRDDYKVELLRFGNVLVPFLEQRIAKAKPAEAALAKTLLTEDLGAQNREQRLFLLDSLRNEKLDDPRQALHALTKMKDEGGEASVLLFELLTRENKYKQYSADILEALYRLSKQTFTHKPSGNLSATWLQALKDARSGARHMAALLLTPHLEGLSDKAIPFLKKDLEQDDTAILLATTATIARLGKPAITACKENLLLNLNDANQDLRQTTRSALLQVMPAQDIDASEVSLSLEEAVKQTSWVLLTDKNLIYTLMRLGLKAPSKDGFYLWGCTDASCKMLFGCERRVAVLFAPQTQSNGSRLAIVRFSALSVSTNQGAHDCNWLAASRASTSPTVFTALFSLKDHQWTYLSTLQMVIPFVDGPRASDYVFEKHKIYGPVIREIVDNSGGEEGTPDTIDVLYAFRAGQLVKIEEKNKPPAPAPVPVPQEKSGKKKTSDLDSEAIPE